MWSENDSEQDFVEEKLKENHTKTIREIAIPLL